MRFECTRRVREDVYGKFHLVDKVSDAGERYLVASFEDEGLAKAALAMLALSEEVKHGATVDFGNFQT